MDRIDIDKILESKAPRLKRYIPRFVIKWLRGLIQEDVLNCAIDNYGDKSPLEFIRGAFKILDIQYKVEGFDGIDPNGRYIFASNHPFGGMDGMMLAEAIGSRLGDVRVVINDLLMYMEPLRPIWLPVNKLGRQNSEYARRMREAFESELPIMTFPAGLCSRRTKGVVADVPWRKSFIKQAHSTDRQVVPVFVEGQLSNRFYNIANLRKKLGVKFNIEMILLVDEMVRQKGQTFTLRFGKPISREELAAVGSHDEQVVFVRKKVDEMKNKVEKSLQLD